MTGPNAADFPIPSDIEGFWMWDKMHCPRPNTPMTQELVPSGWTDGFTRAMDAFSSPFGVDSRFINYYFYMTIVPLDPGSQTMEERVATYQETLATKVPQIGKLWQNEWLPSILPGLEKARTLDYRSMSDSQLMATLHELHEDMIYRTTVHGWINYIAVAASQFGDFYNETFAQEDQTEPFQALQGFVTKSVEAGNGLWRLSRSVRGSGTLRRAFETLEPNALIAELEKSEEGRSFLADLRAYLDDFGWRSDVFELADPTWRENPAIPLNAIQGYILLDDDHDPAKQLAESVRVRDELLARARERLKDDPEKLQRFNDLYDAARLYAHVTEDHNFYIDQIGNAVMRLPVLELGRRLAERRSIRAADDVFLLFLSEVEEGLAGKDQSALVEERRAEMDKWSAVVPAPTIGEPPPLTGDPWEQALVVKFFGMPPEPSRDPSIINGLPASPGTVRAPAKVVRTLAEAGKLETGDILVCEMTMPPWTPLFSTIAAVVADTGGILSHCAVVAREYRIPCVVGTVVGTSVIKDGMVLTVDGSKGIIRIEQG